MIRRAATIVLGLALAAGTAAARADVVLEWNQRTTDLISEARLGTPPAYRVMAYVQTATRDAVAAAVARNVSVEAAVAGAHRAALTRLLPAQEAAVQALVTKALAAVPEGNARTAGLEIGEQAAAALFTARGDDGAAAPERYRPFTTPGSYVPTAAVAVPQWAQRKTWLLARPDQFRPGPPPALNTAAWARDYNEVKALGSRTSTARSADQTEAARFWEFSLPSIYYGVVQSAARMPGRDVQRNARLLAAVAQGMDDAMIAVIDAKYHHNFWRPVTAIRNGDIDGNDATERDAGWLPLIDAPLHPEYPSAHSILAATVATVLRSDLRGAAEPGYQTTSGSLRGVVRKWSRLDDFAQEVANARIHEGIHYRFSTEAGLAMGRQVGALAAAALQGASGKAGE